MMACRSDRHAFETPYVVNSGVHLWIRRWTVGAPQFSGLGGVSHAGPIGPQLRMGGPGFPVVASLVIGGPTRSR
jgi:hypothetical protein